MERRRRSHPRDATRRSARSPKTKRSRRVVKASGLPKIRFLDRRHSYATLTLKAGVHPKIVSERLGHATIGITLDLYFHLPPAIAGDLC